ncbi:hypothetical protein CHARACLAT_016828 [Characodon lateralis]|uniref:Uncharacterized protein n=1 Tax=Characodon lateralis TaxID=208331 RepID=A0ABU7EU83_9TELE|nr:hypothetical protein [Characodon lateralis]
MADPDIPDIGPWKEGKSPKKQPPSRGTSILQATKHKPQGQIKSPNWVGDQEACDEGAGGQEVCDKGAGDQEVCDKEAGDEGADDLEVCVGGAGDEGTDGQAASDDQALPGQPRSGGRLSRVEDP